MVIGGIYSQYFEIGQIFYLQSHEENITLPIYYVASAFDMMGDWDLFGGSILITPEIANQLPEFDVIDHSNIFLIRTEKDYSDFEGNKQISNNIEISLNDYENPNSLSSKTHMLIGATGRVVQEEVFKESDEEASVWEFLAVFSTIGLVIGAAGFAIISFRSVSERKQEIGMMRAIGFSKRKVINSILIELIAITTLSLICGILLGGLFTHMFATKFFDVAAKFPWVKIMLYIASTFFVSIILGIIPGRKAANIAPSQALRYTG